MRVLSWNICGLPSYLNMYQNPENVIDHTIDFITNQEFQPDFICLQECFDKNIRSKVFKKFIDYTVVYEEIESRVKINSGLLIITKHTFTDVGFVKYKYSSGEDRLANKGFMYGSYTENNQTYTIYNTHLNNDKPIFNFISDCLTTIERQLFQLIRHAYNKVKQGHIVIIAGDFNCTPYHILYVFNNSVFKNKVKLYNFCRTTLDIDDTSNISENIDHVLIMTSTDTDYIPSTISKVENNICSDHQMLLCNINTERDNEQYIENTNVQIPCY